MPIGGAADPDGVSLASGTMTLEYDMAAGTVAYELVLSGTSLFDDVTAIHIHLAAAGVNGPHALNIFGAPSEDDGDLLVDFGMNELSGLWDATDENFAAVGDPMTRDPGDSIAPADAIADLMAGDAYVAIHTLDFPLPNTSELRGQILPAPEASSAAAAAIAAATLLSLRRRRAVPT